MHGQKSMRASIMLGRTGHPHLQLALGVLNAGMKVADTFFLGFKCENGHCFKFDAIGSKQCGICTLRTEDMGFMPCCKTWICSVCKAELRRRTMPCPLCSQMVEFL